MSIDIEISRYPPSISLRGILKTASVIGIPGRPSWCLWSFESPSSRWLQIGELVVCISLLGHTACILTNCGCLRYEKYSDGVFLGRFLNTFCTTCKWFYDIIKISNTNQNISFQTMAKNGFHACMHTKLIISSKNA